MTARRTNEKQNGMKTWNKNDEEKTTREDGEPRTMNELESNNKTEADEKIRCWYKSNNKERFGKKRKEEKL